MKRIVLTSLTAVLILGLLLIPNTASADTTTLRPNDTLWNSNIYIYPGGEAHEAVDEETSDGDGSYISSSQIGGYPNCGFSLGVSGAGDIASVALCGEARALSAPDRESFILECRTYSTPYQTEFAVTTSYASYSHVYPVNPYTGNAWTWGEVADLYLVVKLRSAQSGDYVSTRCTRAWVEVTVGGVTRPNVIVFAPDGMGRRTFGDLLEDGYLPNIESIVEDGVTVSIENDRYTQTKPGWSMVNTGYYPETMNVFTNWIFTAIPSDYTWLERIEDEWGDDVFTGFVAGKWNELGGDMEEGGALQPYYYSKNGMDFFQNKLSANYNVQQKTLEIINANYTKQMCIFVHFRDPDRTGHIYGENSQEYKDAMINCDSCIGTIMDRLVTLGVFENTLFYVTTDHGFDVDGDEHVDAPYCWLATNDTSVMRRGVLVDIAPTIYETLGMDWESFDPPIEGYPLNLPYNPPIWDAGHGN
jgi:hypothetical protein